MCMRKTSYSDVLPHDKLETKEQTNDLPSNASFVRFEGSIPASAAPDLERGEVGTLFPRPHLELRLTPAYR